MIQERRLSVRIFVYSVIGSKRTSYYDNSRLKNFQVKIDAAVAIVGAVRSARSR
jgi:hypothetical protein